MDKPLKPTYWGGSVWERIGKVINWNVLLLWIGIAAFIGILYYL